MNFFMWSPLWSNMWSFDRFAGKCEGRKIEKIQHSCGFPGPAHRRGRGLRTRTQIKHATSCATPGYGLFHVVAVVVKHVVVRTIRGELQGQEISKNPAFMRLSGPNTSAGQGTAYTHPNQARYQLRYTRILNFVFADGILSRKSTKPALRAIRPAPANHIIPHCRGLVQSLSQKRGEALPPREKERL